METIQDQEIQTVYDLRNIVDDYIDQYIYDNSLDKTKITESIFNDILQELELNIFIPMKRWLKTTSNVSNEYDAIKIYQVFKYIYCHICYKFEQSIYQNKFYNMININKQTLYNITVDRLSSEALDSDKKNLAEIIAEEAFIQNNCLMNSSNRTLSYTTSGNARFDGVYRDANSYYNATPQPNNALSVENLPKLCAIDGQKGPETAEIKNAQTDSE